jgi:hypothetical protein
MSGECAHVFWLVVRVVCLPAMVFALNCNLVVSYFVAGILRDPDKS